MVTLILFLLNKVLLFLNFFFCNLYISYLNCKKKNLILVLILVFINFIKIIFDYCIFIRINFLNDVKYISFFFKLLEYKNLLDVRYEKFKNNNNHNNNNIFRSYYYLKYFFNINKNYFIWLNFLLRYKLNNYYLFYIFYYTMFIRYFFYFYNKINSLFLKILNKLNFVYYFKNFNYYKFSMRVSYKRVKYMHDYRNLKEKLELKKKYIINYMLYINEKLLYFLLIQKGMQFNLYIFKFVHSFISILVFFKDSILESRIFKYFLILKKRWKKKYY